MSTPVLPRVLSFSEAGRYVGGNTPPETVRSWTKEIKPKGSSPGRPPLLRKVNIGRRAFVLREDLDRLIDAQLAADSESSK